MPHIKHGVTGLWNPSIMGLAWAVLDSCLLNYVDFYSIR